ncbi:MAG TPA: ribonuclease catalytic domain-containing protein, partial [Caldimonas sp.]|nr:ribonuclease catalytic domain-containing protein [Caldimonas sp.]
MAKTPAAKNPAHQRADLVRIATQAMLDRGLEPEFSAEALLQLASIKGPGSDADGSIRDLTSLPWCSIDNDDSRDLDQLTACEALERGAVRILVAIADVDAVVGKGSPLDAHAWANTTSVYTSARVFPMLPERLSTDLTSLNADADRLALVTEFRVAADASVSDATVYRARVRNRAKLAYDAVSAWLDGTGPMPAPVRLAAGMDEQLRMQDGVAQRLRAQRHAAGSLEFETLQPHAIFDGDRVVDIREQPHNRGRQLIEELMIV